MPQIPPSPLAPPPPLATSPSCFPPPPKKKEKRDGGGKIQTRVNPAPLPPPLSVERERDFSLFLLLFLADRKKTKFPKRRRTTKVSKKQKKVSKKGKQECCPTAFWPLPGLFGLYPASTKPATGFLAGFLPGFHLYCTTPTRPPQRRLQRLWPLQHSWPLQLPSGLYIASTGLCNAHPAFTMQAGKTKNILDFF